jgi:hypothetical protein
MIDNKALAVAAKQLQGLSLFTYQQKERRLTT